MSSRSARCKRALVRAVMETIEPRRLLAAFVTHPHGVLEVTASDSANVIQATFAAGKLTVDVDGVSQSFPRSQARHVIINALGGDDVVRISDSVDYTVNGGTGNDTFAGGSGADAFAGGEGIDTADYSGRTKRVFLSLDRKANDGARGEHDNLGDDVEVLLGGNGNDGIEGNALANTLRGGVGDDWLIAGLGDDLLDGGEGSDTIDYTCRKDALLVNFSNGGTVKSGLETDTLAADTDVAILGGRGADTFSLSLRANTHVLADGGGGNDLLTATGDQESGTITLRGGSGNDTLNTGTELGADNFFCFGDAGDDIFYDRVFLPFDGGRGNDTFSAEKSANIFTIDLRLMPTVENAILSRLNGGTIIGNDLPNRLSIASPADAACNLQGMGGDDILIGSRFGDTFVGGDGSDTVDYSGRTENLSITLDGIANDGKPNENDLVAGDIENAIGGSGNDTLVGNDQRNRLDGGGGNDDLTGGGARDVLIGGDGDDTAHTDALDRLMGVEHIL